MKKLILTLVVLGVVPCMATVAKAGDGNVPASMLAELGLGDLQVVSDAQGEQIRGKWMPYSPKLIKAISNQVGTATGNAQLAQQTKTTMWDINKAVNQALPGKLPNGSFFLLKVPKF